jgi:2-isopropylmalate synthase
MTIRLYDTTLRDGAQREGASLSVADKLRIAARLDELGVDYIEAGFPASNRRDAEFFERVAAGELTLHHAQLVAFGMTAHKDKAPEKDAGLAALVACPAPVVTLVGKTSVTHVEHTLHATREENLEMIAGSIAYLVAAGKQVFFDAEHYYDGYREDSAYALECLRVAAQAGASALVLCDTNGGLLPHEAYEMTLATVQAFANAGGAPAPPAEHDSAAIDHPAGFAGTPPEEGNYSSNSLACSIPISIKFLTCASARL